MSNLDYQFEDEQKPKSVIFWLVVFVLLLLMLYFLRGFFFGESSEKASEINGISAIKEQAGNLGDVAKKAGEGIADGAESLGDSVASTAKSAADGVSDMAGRAAEGGKSILTTGEYRAREALTATSKAGGKILDRAGDAASGVQQTARDAADAVTNRSESLAADAAGNVGRAAVDRTINASEKSKMLAATAGGAASDVVNAGKETVSKAAKTLEPKSSAEVSSRERVSGRGGFETRPHEVSTPERDSSSRSDTRVATAGGGQQTRAAGQTITVRPGDSLSSIASEVYGDIDKWRLIYDANRENIPNPDVIEPGLTLILPTVQGS